VFAAEVNPKPGKVFFDTQIVPVFVFAPSLGVTPASQAILVLYHVLVAVPVVGFLIGVCPADQARNPRYRHLSERRG